MTEASAIVTAVIAFVVMTVTVLAFITKERTYKPVLHGVGLIGWLVLGYFLVTATLDAFNTFVPTAVGLFSVVMVIAHLTGLIGVVTENRKAKLTYDQDMSIQRRKIYNLTHVPKKLPPWER